MLSAIALNRTPPGLLSAQTSIVVKIRGWAQERVAGQSADVRFGSKADIASGPLHVRFTPKNGHRGVRSPCPLCANSGHSLLFDHIVGSGEQRGRNGKPQRLGTLEIDNGLEFGRLNDWQVT